MGGLFVKRAGRGPRVVLLHGGVLAGELCWRQQLPLADRFRLVIPDQLPSSLAQGVRAIRSVRRRPWEGDLPVDRLAAAPFPKLVISGKHSPAFEAVCDALAARLHADRAHVTGADHATPETGNAFNQTLGAFIRAACPCSLR
jgi:hypothetical protein